MEKGSAAEGDEGVILAVVREVGKEEELVVAKAGVRAEKDKTWLRILARE